MRRALALGAIVAATVAGCGAPERLDREDARRLAVAREQLDEALDRAEALRTSREEARRLVSLVRRRGGQAIGLSRRDGQAFVQYGLTDPARALRGPAEEAVEQIDSAVEDAGPDTRIPSLRDQTVEAYLNEAERDTKQVWADLAERLGQAKDDL